MNFWVIDSKKGITLVYYSSMGIFLDEDIVSGLISALNQLTMIEFKQPIQSIDMGGFKWIYVVDQEINLMFVMSDSIEVSTDTIKGRLNYLENMFYKAYIPNKDKWYKKWTGDVQMFQPFKEVIGKYYEQWTSANHVDSLAEFYDAIGIIQELLNLTKNLIENHCSEEIKVELYSYIDEVIKSFKNNPDIKKEEEFQKITFSGNEGFDIFEIDPMNCNISNIIEHIKNLVLEIFTLLKRQLGYDVCLLNFHKEEIFKFIYGNLSLIKTLNLDHFMLKLILIE